MTSPDPREDRLPKWARDALRQQREEIRALRARLDPETHFADTDTTVTDFRIGETLRLPPGSRVRFESDGDRFDSYLEARIHPETRRIHLHGGRPFAVFPRSANTAEVEILEPGQW